MPLPTAADKAAIQQGSEPASKGSDQVGGTKAQSVSGAGEVFRLVESLLYKLVLSSSTASHEVVAIRSNELLGLTFEK